MLEGLTPMHRRADILGGYTSNCPRCHLPWGRCQSAQAGGQHGSAAEHHFVTGAAQFERRTTGGSRRARGWCATRCAAY